MEPGRAAGDGQADTISDNSPSNPGSTRFTWPRLIEGPPEPAWQIRCVQAKSRGFSNGMHCGGNVRSCGKKAKDDTPTSPAGRFPGKISPVPDPACTGSGVKDTSDRRRPTGRLTPERTRFPYVMTTNAAHLDYNPGLADHSCPPLCAHLVRPVTGPICVAFDRRLKQENNLSIRAKECMNRPADRHYEAND